MRRFRNPETEKFESGRVWRNTSAYFRRLNPVCQVIEEDGRRCISKPAAVHHLIAPEVRPDLKTSFKNLVSVCARHHNPSQGDVGKYMYVPTKLEDGTLFEHLRVEGPELQPTGTPNAKQFISASPSSEVVDRLCAEALALLGE